MSWRFQRGEPRHNRRHREEAEDEPRPLDPAIAGLIFPAVPHRSDCEGDGHNARVSLMVVAISSASGPYCIAAPTAELVS